MLGRSVQHNNNKPGVSLKYLQVPVACKQLRISTRREILTVSRPQTLPADHIQVQRPHIGKESFSSLKQQLPKTWSWNLFTILKLLRLQRACVYGDYVYPYLLHQKILRLRKALNTLVCITLFKYNNKFFISEYRISVVVVLKAKLARTVTLFYFFFFVTLF